MKNKKYNEEKIYLGLRVFMLFHTSFEHGHSGTNVAIVFVGCSITSPRDVFEIRNFYSLLKFETTPVTSIESGTPISIRGHINSSSGISEAVNPGSGTMVSPLIHKTGIADGVHSNRHTDSVIQSSDMVLEDTNVMAGNSRANKCKKAKQGLAHSVAIVFLG